MAKQPTDCTLLHYDGNQWTAYKARRTNEATFRTSEPERLEVGSDGAVYAGQNVYVLAAARLDLLREADFHRGRRRVALNSLFDNSGDIMDMVRTAAWIVAVVVSFLTYTSVSSLSTAIGHLASLIK